MDSADADKVAQFSAITGANPSTAQAALNAANGNIEDAVGLYFAATENNPSHDADADFDGEDDEQLNEAMAQSAGSSSNPQQQQQQQQPSASSSSSAAGKKKVTNKPRGGPMTLRDIQRGNDDDDDDDDDPDKKQDMFAGGEKSGLAVQNPDKDKKSGGSIDHFKNIMKQARENRARPGGEDEENQTPQRNHFAGRAQTLGGDDAPSQIINDGSQQQGRQPSSLPRVTRTLHLWQDGVSIDDGPLFRFDDPANREILAQINQGRAPLSLLDVAPDQEVDLNLEPHKDEKYVQPKAVYKPFGGSGNRLGAPTPGPAPASSSSSATTTAAAAAPAPQAAAGQEAKMPVDESTPTVQLQIRLGDGTQLRSRFNTTHTVGDVYDFVGRASAASGGRSWALMTTFPSRELSDKSQMLGEMSEYRRGGVVVQKWT